MSTTCYTGKDGALHLGGTAVAQLTSWTVTQNVDTIECTHMGQSWKDYKVGIKEWEASFEAIYSGTKQGLSANLEVGAEYALIAYPESGDTDHSASGNVILTSVEVTAELDDVIRVSVTAVGTGTLTFDSEDNA